MKLPSPQHSLRRRARQAGLTLIELLIVLLVIVAVAGIVVPLFPNIQRRAHASTCAGNITETHKAIQLFAATNLRQPNGWDSLISPPGETFRVDRFTVVALNNAGAAVARTRAALNSAGITQSFELADGIQGNGMPDGHVTRQNSTGRLNSFNNATLYTGNAFDLTADGSVVLLGGTVDPATGAVGGGTQEILRFNLPLPGPGSPYVAYVAFGVGNQLTALSNTMLEPPTHFPQEGDLDPTRVYGRFVAIYGIPAGSGPAVHLRTAAVHNNHFDSLGMNLRDYYASVSN